MRGIRGAICAHANTKREIYRATQYLLSEMVGRNGVETDEIVAAFFTMTPDLDADFPAYAARDMGWTGVPMLGSQESLVPGGPERAIRVLLLVSGDGPAQPVYLGRAAAMRPDLAQAGDAEQWNGPAEASASSSSESGRLGRLLVVGLGLMGGSLGVAARASGLFTGVCGYDRDRETGAVALRRGLVDSVAESLETELARADMVVLAVPVLQIIDLLGQVGKHLRAGAVVTDVGSTKRRIVDAMALLPRAVHAVGGHPMTGRTSSGASAAAADLFRGAKWALVETPATDEEAIGKVEALVRGIGAQPVRMSAAAHDEMVAFTSHLPAAMAIELVRLTAGLGGRLEIPELLAGPGFASASRLAAGDPLMTAEMLASNADNLNAAVGELIESLRDFARTVVDPVSLADRIAGARALRESLVEEPAG
ncbi:MAG: chorismate mutase [Gemmatimonadota bacterium]